MKADRKSPEMEQLFLDEVRQQMTEQVLSLSEKQKSALRDYTGFTAMRVNTAIGAKRIMPAVQKQIDRRDDALRDGVMPETVVLHRDTALAYLQLGVSDRPSEEELGRIVDRIVTNTIFTSTGFDNLHLPGRNTEIWLTVPKGTRGCRYLKPVASEKYAYQDEVLFSRGLRYRVTNVKVENGKYILWAEVLK